MFKYCFVRHSSTNSKAKWNGVPTDIDPALEHEQKELE